MTEDKCTAMKKLQEVSFVLDEIRLFLDTHPFDKEALTCYENYRGQREKALSEYETAFGPVEQYRVKENTMWNWVNNPWPWEGAV